MSSWYEYYWGGGTSKTKDDATQETSDLDKIDEEIKEQFAADDQNGDQSCDEIIIADENVSVDRPRSLGTPCKQME